MIRKHELAIDFDLLPQVQALFHEKQIVYVLRCWPYSKVCIIEFYHTDEFAKLVEDTGTGIDLSK